MKNNKVQNNKKESENFDNFTGYNPNPSKEDVSKIVTNLKECLTEVKLVEELFYNET
tara:strand:+ start:193 stop:363 length:171 start_codon:yes stop_codon:yes gene_type:complete